MKEPISIRQHRIGNILSYKDRPYYVSFLSLDIDDEYEDQIGVVELGKTTNEISGWNREEKIYNHLEPLPLTEGWLIKFGFEKNEEYDFGFSGNKAPRFEKMDISIMLSSNKFWYATRQYDGGTSDPFETFREVKHVHQLQNLYFALTGEELTIS